VKRMGRLNKMITLSVLIIVMKSICDSLVISRQELGQPIFLDGIFGLTHSNEDICHRSFWV
jgi:phosphopantetheinyl transferase